MRKRVLFLHGLESSNVCSKVDFLKEVSDCYAPAINYADPYIEDLLLKMVRAFNPNVIIGSSMGGYSALLLGNYFGIWCDHIWELVHDKQDQVYNDIMESLK